MQDNKEIAVMEAGRMYYRTKQHMVPAEVAQGTVWAEHGGRAVATHYRNWRQGSGEQTLDTRKLVATASGVARVELLTFQMAIGTAGSSDAEAVRYVDLVASGFVANERSKEVLEAWCTSGTIPENFKRVGEQGA